jgi:transposase
MVKTLAQRIEKHGSTRATAQALGVSRKFVTKWCSQAKLEGNVDTKIRGASPRKFTEKVLKKSMKVLKHKKTGALRRASKHLLSKGISISKTTLGKYRPQFLSKKVPRRIPILREANKVKRLAFATRH